MVVKTKKRSSSARKNDNSPAGAGKPIDPKWAWAPYQPTAQRPWNLKLAGHLYRRAAFGADWKQLQQALTDGPQPTIDILLHPSSGAASFNQSYDDFEAGANSVDALRAWWLRRMIYTPHPLLEKITLFWHSHFAVNSTPVKDAPLMRQYLQLLRSGALGSFRGLLQNVSRDPALLIWLDAVANRKARPNENLARPLLETFTVGPGGYAEKDVKEAARAFTGWFILGGRSRYFDREHDGGTKTFLNQKGNFDRDDVIRIILEQPATSHLIVRKLYRWLISETEPPDDILIAPLTDIFAEEYDITKVVETMLRSNLFFSPRAYRQRIKSPVEFALGIVKGMETVVSTTQLAQDLAGLGQNLYNPPTVQGWSGGQHWINNATIISRHNLALSLLRPKGPYGDKLNPEKITQKHGFPTGPPALRFLLDLFLQSDLDPGLEKEILNIAQTPIGSEKNEPQNTLRRWTHKIITLPEFHLA